MIQSKCSLTVDVIRSFFGIKYLHNGERNMFDLKQGFKDKRISKLRLNMTLKKKEKLYNFF